MGHESDGAWQFLCGESDHAEKNAKIISLKEAMEIDQAINDLYEMPVNVGAQRRSRTDRWVPFRMQE